MRNPIGRPNTARIQLSHDIVPAYWSIERGPRAGMAGRAERDLLKVEDQPSFRSSMTSRQCDHADFALDHNCGSKRRGVLLQSRQDFRRASAMR